MKRFGLLLVLASAHAMAQDFYTVDVNTNQLVRFNWSTGAATAIGGGLGLDVSDVDLAWHQGVLYGLDQNRQTTPRLFAIDTTTGLAYNQVNINAPGANVAEGLASNGSQLWLTWGTDTINSTQFGLVSTAGVVNTILNQPSVDWDGLYWSGGRFYSLDYEATGLMLYFGGAAPSAAFGPLNAGGNFYNDVVVTNGGSVGYTIANTGFRGLLNYNAPGWSLVPPINRPGTYYGLEAVPEPASIAGLLMGSLAILRRRKK